MAESMKTRALRWAFNLFPAFRGTGGRIRYIASDFREVRLVVPLSWRTRNYVGTIYGGSMYGAVDPIYMVMLLRVLGPDYLVWDKAASIRFLKPGRSTLHARFVLTDELLAEIRSALETEKSIERHFTIDLTDDEGVTRAVVEKTLWLSKKRERAA